MLIMLFNELLVKELKILNNRQNNFILKEKIDLDV